ncbi:MAG TPA: IclR family transcriptional regulator C-terminal domain-containing protein [Euzebyales bacterium]|nr:IclR family transcriptional regulator C-terminal domain-containing protein [Euzebyales bacterium]
MRSETPPSDLIRSVSRALRLLEEVGNHPAGVNPKRLASRCGIRLPTVYHLLRTLRYEGYLDRLPSGDYVLGTAIAERFGDLAPMLAVPPPVPAVLDDLARRTGHSAYLARFVDGRVTITSVVEASGSPPLEDLVVGFDDAAHATALGKALLSTLSARRRRRYLRDTGLRRFTTATVTTTDRLSDELRSAMPTGVFTEVEQFRDGVGCVAALVHRSDGDDNGYWALGMSHRATHIPRQRARLVPSLRRAAADLATV